MKGISLFFWIASILLTGVVSAQEELPERTWTSKTGTEAKAFAKGLDGDRVILQKANGSIIKVPLSLLIEADQKILRDHFTKGAADPAVKDPAKDDVSNTGGQAIGKKNPKQKDLNGSTIDLPYKLGEKAIGIEVERGLKANFYIPSTLRAGEKYAVLMIIEPKRGSHGRMDDFISAAEENEMIIATLPKQGFRTRPEGDKGKNWPKNRVYIDEIALLPYIKDTLRKLHKDFPIDTKRIYTVGIADSCYIAMWAMKKLDGAGMLAINGGGKGTFTASNREAFLAMCATRSRNRYDVASTFSESKGSSLSRMSFYSGNGFPGKTDLDDAMLQLNGMFLLKHQKGTHALAAERYEKALMETIDDISGDPVMLNVWLEFADDFGLKDEKNEEKLEELRKEIMKDANGVKALKGYNDTVKTLLRYFGTGHLGYRNEQGKKSTQSSIKRIAKKYEGTLWQGLLEDLAEPSN